MKKAMRIMVVIVLVAGLAALALSVLGGPVQRACPLHWDKQDWLNKPAEGVEDETGTSHQ